MEQDLRFKADYSESEYNRNLSKDLGHAMRLLASCKKRDCSIKSVVEDLWAAVQLRQIMFLYNSSGAPTAYVTWMHVTQDVAELLSTNPLYRVHLSERNEGHILWITEIVAPFGNLRTLVKKLMQTQPHNDGYVVGVRRNEQGIHRVAKASLHRTGRSVPS